MPLRDILRYAGRTHVGRDLLGLHAQILGSLALAGLIERLGHLIAELLQPVENFGLQLLALSSLSQAALIASAICLPSLLNSSVMERPSTFGSSDMVASSCKKSLWRRR